jgi:hypothetical protein
MLVKNQRDETADLSTDGPMWQLNIKLILSRNAFAYRMHVENCILILFARSGKHPLMLSDEMH